MITADAFVEQFDRDFDEVKDLAYAAIPREFTLFAKEEGITGKYIRRTSISGPGTPSVNQDYDQLPLDVPVKGPVYSFQPDTYRLGYIIDRATIEDEEYGHLADRPATMLTGAVLVKELAAADLLNSGTTAQAWDSTGVALFSTAHTREDGVTTWANRNSTELPITVETVMSAIVDYLHNLKDMRGNIINYTGSYNIYVPSTNATLFRQAIEVVNSMMNPNTTDNKINAVTKQFKLNVVPLRYLTNTNVWFIGWEPEARYCIHSDVCITMVRVTSEFVLHISSLG